MQARGAWEQYQPADPLLVVKISPKRNRRPFNDGRCLPALPCDNQIFLINVQRLNSSHAKVGVRKRGVAQAEAKLETRCDIRLQLTLFRNVKAQSRLGNLT
jgi:hypothetical protein